MFFKTISFQLLYIFKQSRFLDGNQKKKFQFTIIHFFINYIFQLKMHFQSI